MKKPETEKPKTPRSGANSAEMPGPENSGRSATASKAEKGEKDALARKRSEAPPDRAGSHSRNPAFNLFEEAKDILEKDRFFKKMDKAEKEDFLREFSKSTFMDLTLDDVFKRVFLEGDNLAELLSDLIGEPIKEIGYTLVHPNLPGIGREKRTAEFDFLVRLADDRMIICEMQKGWMKDILYRMMFYGARVALESQGKGRGKEYSFPATYVVCVYSYSDAAKGVEFTPQTPEGKVFKAVKVEKNPDKDPLRWILMTEPGQPKFYDLIHLVILELANLEEKELKDMNDIEKWAYIFKNSTKFADDILQDLPEKYRNVLNSARNSNITSRKELINYLKAMKTKNDNSYNEKALSEAFEKKGIEIGTSNGIEIGKAEQIKKTFKSLLKKGFSRDFIIEVVGITSEDFDKLAKELNLAPQA